MTAGRDALVTYAAQTIAAGSKSFAAASRLFAPAVRARAQLLYAWCRACDDMIDGQEMGHGMRRLDDGAARLEAIQALTGKALEGEATGHPAFDCLAMVAGETRLPAHYPYDLIAGFALDAAGWRPHSEADLYRYCYHVAGSVGCMMAIVMGVDPHDDATLDRACDLGIAFQLANIARDVGEDAAVGRCYLPGEWLAEDGIVPGLAMLDHPTALARFTARLAEAALGYEESARIGARRLPYRSRWAVLAAAGIYGAVARKVADQGEAALTKRVVTGKLEKLGFIISAAVSAALPASTPEPPRLNLWTRPRWARARPVDDGGPAPPSAPLAAGRRGSRSSPPPPSSRRHDGGDGPG
ncbi:phytoene/squalene synthase family protein [Sphingomonas sp. XMGL2]|uniref:Phytoene/squalene synthase family protein n=1 Tax=Sphingomonas quercus TaxID=2842451 RepID=A0ABS6BGQ1_9SPHN|nr:phytoene/squalene synthase family protein [Sphingomonas quercus]